MQPDNPDEFIYIYVLIFSNNYFTGTIPEFWTTLPFLVDLGGASNYLTGTIPTFNQNDFVAFSVSINCLHGTIPEFFCEHSFALEALILNGLSSASNCRHNLFPGTDIQTFTQEYSSFGSLPSCLFNISTLSILQVSGNGLTGTLPSEDVTMSNLQNLVLSHNSLSGTIPTIFQERSWDNFDLSYNFFTGELSQDFHEVNQDSSITLSVNHLSGWIPNNLLNANSINILDGNLFTCNYDNRYLPSNDPNYETYACGSDEVNLTLYLWISFMGMISILFVIFYYCPKSKSSSSSALSSMHEYLMKMIQWYAYFHEYCEREYENQINHENANENDSSENIKTKKESNSIVTLRSFNQKARFTCAILTCFILLFLLPSYGVASRYLSSYQVKYAWTISGLFLTGKESGILLSIELFLFLAFAIGSIFFVWNLRLYYSTSSSSLSSASSISSTTSSDVFFFFFSKSNRKHEDSSSSPVSPISSRSRSSNSFINNQQDSPRSMNRWDLLCYLIVSFINLLGMLSVDILYVFIVINYDPIISFFAEVGLAIGKTFWNNSLLWSLLERLKDYFHLINRSTSVDSSEKLADYDISFLSLTTGLNNVIYPIIAIMGVSTNCFYQAIVQPSPVTTTFSTLTIIGGHYSEVVATSSYDPPFSYSYQCSSVIYTFYCPVFILMLILEAVIIPVVHFLALYWVEKYDAQPRSIVISSSSSISELPPLEDPEDKQRTISKIELTSRSKEFTSKDFFHPIRSGDNNEPPTVLTSSHEKASKMSSKQPRISFFSRWSQRISTSPSILLSTQNHHHFNKGHYALRFSSYLLVLIAFGAVFPPLAVISYLAVVFRSLYCETLVGRTLFCARSSTTIEMQLKKECRGLMNPMKYALSIIIPITSLLFSYLIFDSFGPKESIVLALTPGIIFSCLSLMIIIFIVFIAPKFMQKGSFIHEKNEEVESISIENPLRK
jgi:hypothetical protein